MGNNILEKPTEESVRLAMKIAWEDHHHARNQTWKAVQFVGLLLIAVITVEYKLHNLLATIASGLILIVAAIFSILITFQHRKLERRKFFHIMMCEEWLGIHQSKLIPLKMDGEFKKLIDDPEYLSNKIQEYYVDLPKEYHFKDIFNFKINNTSIFIVRMLALIVLFVFIFILFSYYK